MQDSCHLRHAQRLPLSSAVSLRRIPGLTVVEPAEQDICCGSAGIYNITQPDAARQLGDRKAATCSPPERRCTRAPTLAASSRSRRRFGGPGARCPALHPIEIVDASIRNIGAAGLLASGPPLSPRLRRTCRRGRSRGSQRGPPPRSRSRPWTCRDRGRRRGRPSRAARRRPRGSGSGPTRTQARLRGRGSIASAQSLPPPLARRPRGTTQPNTTAAATAMTAQMTRNSLLPCSSGPAQVPTAASTVASAIAPIATGAIDAFRDGSAHVVTPLFVDSSSVGSATPGCRRRRALIRCHPRRRSSGGS